MGLHGLLQDIFTYQRLALAASKQPTATSALYVLVGRCVRCMFYFRALYDSSRICILARLEEEQQQCFVLQPEMKVATSHTSGV
jgi:hypothetical protein